jgi:dCMP deaminase
VHAGHEGFFARHADAAEVLILGAGFRAQFESLAKDIRALPPMRAAQFLQVMLPLAAIRVIEPSDLPAAVMADTLVLPDEDITRRLAAEHRLAEGRELIFDKTFLRWDREWSQATRSAGHDGTVAVGDLPPGLLAQARELAGHSSDWWRQVGAIAWRGAEILGAAWNRHAPTEYAPYVDGDPRDNFSRGVRADLSTAAHAEASVIARAARDGIRLAGADIYVTTFPCPACARLIAESAFRRCYFTGAYSVLEGDQVLRAAGVELSWVDAPARLPEARRWRRPPLAGEAMPSYPPYHGRFAARGARREGTGRRGRARRARPGCAGRRSRFAGQPPPALHRRWRCLRGGREHLPAEPGCSRRPGRRRTGPGAGAAGRTPAAAVKGVRRPGGVPRPAAGTARSGGGRGGPPGSGCFRDGRGWQD